MRRVDDGDLLICVGRQSDISIRAKPEAARHVLYAVPVRNDDNWRFDSGLP
jgi:hypothetical protein